LFFFVNRWRLAVAVNAFESISNVKSIPGLVSTWVDNRRQMGNRLGVQPVTHSDSAWPSPVGQRSECKCWSVVVVVGVNVG